MAERPESDAAGRGAKARAEEMSKKDVLAETGISYGQFYRWKRMGLIPESWFRRRSTFTGQETFLPRRRVLERIGRIQDLKDRYSLEELAEMFSPDVSRRAYSLEEVEAMDWVSPQARALMPAGVLTGPMGFREVLCLTVIERFLVAKHLSPEQIRLAGAALLECFDGLGQDAQDRQLAVLVREGVTSVALYTGTCLFDSGVRVAATVDFGGVIEQIRVNLRRQFE